jgi:hypothetical protein
MKMWSNLGIIAQVWCHRGEERLGRVFHTLYEVKVGTSNLLQKIVQHFVVPSEQALNITILRIITLSILTLSIKIQILLRITASSLMELNLTIKHSA